MLLPMISFSQTESKPLYRQFLDLPPLFLDRIPDSSALSKEDFQNKKPVLIMMFSPDCDHCHRQTRSLLDSIQYLEKVQILLVSNASFSAIQKYYQDFKLADHANIIVARDARFLLGTFFQIKKYPSLFAYTRRLKLIEGFSGNVPIATLIDLY
ncbi:MAG: hypothetical protein RLY16_2750 [Bacteroidota bacterium]